MHQAVVNSNIIRSIYQAILECNLTKINFLKKSYDYWGVIYDFGEA